MRKKRAFTLVELLVVIGIIALLISILMPVLGKVNQAALQLKCSANLRSMGQAMTLYVQEFKHYPGHAGLDSSGQHPIAVWPIRLRNILKGGQLMFWCPATEPGFQWQKVLGPPGGRFATTNEAKYGYTPGEQLLFTDSSGGVTAIPFSYGYNDWGSHNVQFPQRGLGGDLWNPGSPELAAAQVRRASEMIAIADNTADGSWDFNIDPTNALEYPGKIHRKGSNVLFCDGHVVWYTQKQLTDINGTQGQMMARMWNNDNQP